MIDEFCARFAPNGDVLFRRDRPDGPPPFENDLSELGVDLGADPLELPDAIVSVAGRNWLILMQSGSVSGPIVEDRRDELGSLFSGACADLVYVSCFATRAELGAHPVDIAWGSSVWCADEPAHLIHFNGDQLLGPFETSAASTG